MTDFRIRRARADDAAACAAIYAPFVTDTWISFETQPPSAGEMLKRISAWGGTYGWLVAVRHRACGVPRRPALPWEARGCQQLAAYWALDPDRISQWAAKAADLSARLGCQ